MSVRSLHTAHHLCETFIQTEHTSWLSCWTQLQLSHCFLVCWVWYWVRHSNGSYETAISNKKSTVCKLAVSSSHKPFSKSSSRSRNSYSLSKLSGYRLRSGRISWQTPGAGARLPIKSSVSVAFQQEDDSKYSLSFSLPSHSQLGSLKNTDLQRSQLLRPLLILYLPQKWLCMYQASFHVWKPGSYTILSKTLLADSSPDSLLPICALKWVKSNCYIWRPTLSDPSNYSDLTTAVISKLTGRKDITSCCRKMF